MKIHIFFLICLLFLFIGCKNDTKIFLEKFRENNKINLSNLEEGYDKNVKREFKNEVEYGIIVFLNNDTVKYWFLSHHIVKDYLGGTLFEFPKGKTKFVKGIFCCELQLPKESIINAEQFLEIMDDKDGQRP